MNKQLENIYKKIYLFLFGLLAFSISFYDRFAAIAIVLIMFTWLIEGKFKEKFRCVKENKFRQYILYFGAIYLIYLIGALYSKNQYYAYSDLQTMLSLVIFPLLFATIDEQILNQKKDKILFYYIIGCVVTTVVLLIHSFTNFLESASMDEFFYGKLSWYHHASYLAMFLVFAIGILFFQIYRTDQKQSKKYQTLSSLLIIYFSSFVMLLSSKAGIISLLIIFLCHIVYLTFSKKYIVSISMLLIYSLSLWGSTTFLSVSSKRLSVAQQAIESEDFDKSSTESTIERILIYRSALSIIKENVLFGVGTGDANNELLKFYKNSGYSGALDSKLNAHNQYLQTFIAIGLVGFLVLIAMLLIPFIQAIKQREALYVLLLFLISFNLLFESMFERQAGVVFYSFFNGFFFFYMNNKKIADD